MIMQQLVLAKCCERTGGETSELLLRFNFAPLASKLKSLTLNNVPKETTQTQLCLLCVILELYFALTGKVVNSTRGIMNQTEQ